MQVHKHECLKLQNDWKLYGEQVFNFVILEIGPVWLDRIKRLQTERYYIQQYKSNCYNQRIVKHKQSVSININRRNSIPIIANDQRFNSISEATRHFGVSFSTIHLRLNNPKYSDWYYLNKDKRVATSLTRAVVVNDKYYISVGICASAEEISEKTVRKNIKMKSNWNYFDKLSKEQKEKIPKLNEQIQTSKLKSYKLGRSVQVKNKIFSSIRQASFAFSIDTHTVRKRIKSKNFSDWKWLDE